MYVEEKMIHNFFFFLTFFFFFFSFEIFLGGITFAVSLAISTTYYLYGSLTATFVLVTGRPLALLPTRLPSRRRLTSRSEVSGLGRRPMPQVQEELRAFTFKYLVTGFLLVHYCS